MGGEGAAPLPSVFWKTELSSRESSRGMTHPGGGGRAACPLGSGFFGIGWLLTEPGEEVTALRVFPKFEAVIPVLAR